MDGGRLRVSQGQRSTLGPHAMTVQTCPPGVT